MEWIRFIAAAICISGGVFVMISAAIGVYRFSECLTRMHAAAMGDTLGLGLIILGLIVLFGFSFTTVKLVLVVAFLWTTGPVSSHLIAQMMVEKKKSIVLIIILALKILLKILSRISYMRNKKKFKEYYEELEDRMQNAESQSVAGMDAMNYY